jgi:hypothetical protein
MTATAAAAGTAPAARAAGGGGLAPGFRSALRRLDFGVHSRALDPSGRAP